MPAISDFSQVNHDETADKIPKCFGFWNAVCVPIVCLPIFGLLTLFRPCIKRNRKKIDEEAAAVAVVVTQALPVIPAAIKEERKYRAQGGMMEPPKRRPAGPGMLAV